jgi:hypothetical protein
VSAEVEDYIPGPVMRDFVINMYINETDKMRLVDVKNILKVIYICMYMWVDVCLDGSASVYIYIMLFF